MTEPPTSPQAATHKPVPPPKPAQVPPKVVPEVRKAPEPTKAPAKPSDSKGASQSSSTPKVVDGVEVLGNKVREGETSLVEYDGSLKAGTAHLREANPNKVKAQSSSTIKVRADGVEVLGNRVKSGEKPLRSEEKE